MYQHCFNRFHRSFYSDNFIFEYLSLYYYVLGFALFIFISSFDIIVYFIFTSWSVYLSIYMYRFIDLSILNIKCLAYALQWGAPPLPPHIWTWSALGMIYIYSTPLPTSFYKGDNFIYYLYVVKIYNLGAFILNMISWLKTSFVFLNKNAA
jgi:hypothetical protein